MKRIIMLLLVFSLIFLRSVNVFAENENKNVAETGSEQFAIDAKAAVLMEAETGKILYSHNENESLPPASVTKVMTLLLIAEAIAKGSLLPDEMLTVSSYAASMGGSQVFLREGEKISVEELLKCTVIASANDAAVALAERVGGSESNFVSMMNSRAKELGMENTVFENVTGLDDTVKEHRTSAKDIALMSRELIKHEIILKYSSLWQDNIRDGEFTLTNTNRLVRFYDGCTGLKTGSTDKAGYCISATAERRGMHLIAVIMGAKTRDVRNAEARKLLDFGFATYSIYSSGDSELCEVPVKFGSVDTVKLKEDKYVDVIPNSLSGKIEKVYTLPDALVAPISKDEAVGKVEYMIDGEKVGESNIYAISNVDKLSFLSLYKKLLCSVFYDKSGN